MCIAVVHLNEMAYVGNLLSGNIMNLYVDSKQLKIYW